MGKLVYDNKNAEEVLSAASVNSLFGALKDTSDGTVSSLDADNVRDGGLTSQHLAAGQVHRNLGTASSGSVTTGTSRSSGTGGAATAWLDILDVTLTSPVQVNEGDVVRWHFNPLVGEAASSGNTPAGTKAQQVYYWRVLLLYNTGGGTITTVIQQPCGYGLSSRSGNDASVSGSDGDLVAPWCRNALAGIWINRGQTWTIEGVRLQFRWAVNDGAAANSIETCHVNGSVVLEVM